MANDVRRHYSRYVDGNAARTLPVPEREPARRPQRTTKRPPKKEKYEKRVVVRKKVSLLSVAITIASICLAFYICISYVMVFSDIIVTEKQISSIQSDIERAKMENEMQRENIDSSVDLQEIYDIATKKLGMIHAGKDQVYTYKNSRSDRVVQYSDIPE